MKLPRTFASKLKLESLPQEDNNDKYGEAHTIKVVTNNDIEIDQIEFPARKNVENQTWSS